MEGDIPVFTTGDVNAFEYGGGVLYYQPQYDEMLWVFWDEPLEDEEDIEKATYRVYMFRWSPDVDLLSSPHGPLDWARDDVEKVCRSMDCDPDEFRNWARGSIIEQLRVAEYVQGYWGAENLDHSPYEESYKDLFKRYDKDLDKAAKNNADKAIEIVDKARSHRGKELKAKLLR